MKTCYWRDHRGSHYSALVAYFITLAARAPFIKMLQSAPECVQRKTHTHTSIPYLVVLYSWMGWGRLCVTARVWRLIPAGPPPSQWECVHPYYCNTLWINSCEWAPFLLHHMWSFTSVWLFLPRYNPLPSNISSSSSSSLSVEEHLPPCG